MPLQTPTIAFSPHHNHGCRAIHKDHTLPDILAQQLISTPQIHLGDLVRRYQLDHRQMARNLRYEEVLSPHPMLHTNDLLLLFLLL